MSERNENEELEIARLKRAFGGPLDERERALLAGDEAPGSAGWLRAQLAAWEPAPDAEAERRAEGPADLVARFETTTVAKAAAFQRGFARFVALVAAVSAVPALLVVYLKTGGLPPLAVLEVLALMWGMMGLFCLACWLRARRILRDEDLVRSVSGRESGRARRGWKRAVVVLLLLVLLAFEARRSGWLAAAGAMGALAVAMTLAERWLRRGERARRMREDRELWSWWYGEGS